MPSIWPGMYDGCLAILAHKSSCNLQLGTAGRIGHTCLIWSEQITEKSGLYNAKVALFYWLAMAIKLKETISHLRPKNSKKKAAVLLR